MDDKQGAGTQCDRLLTYLLLHGSITPADAYRELGIPAVMRRIHDLRRRGIRIDTVDETGTNRFGEKCTYARYRLAATVDADGQGELVI